MPRLMSLTKNKGRMYYHIIINRRAHQHLRLGETVGSSALVK